MVPPIPLVSVRSLSAVAAPVTVVALTVLEVSAAGDC